MKIFDKKTNIWLNVFYFCKKRSLFLLFISFLSDFFYPQVYLKEGAVLIIKENTVVSGFSDNISFSDNEVEKTTLHVTKGMVISGFQENSKTEIYLVRIDKNPNKRKENIIVEKTKKRVISQNFSQKEIKFRYTDTNERFSVLYTTKFGTAIVSGFNTLKNHSERYIQQHTSYFKFFILYTKENHAPVKKSLDSEFQLTFRTRPPPFFFTQNFLKKQTKHKSYMMD